VAARAMLWERHGGGGKDGDLPVNVGGERRRELPLSQSSSQRSGRALS
jgi:hypothetical protein